MPLNYRQAQEQIREMGEKAGLQQRELSNLIERANRRLDLVSSQVDDLRELVSAAAARNPNLRSAVPVQEALTFSTPAPALPAAYTLLAADGSQINPDRDAQVEFGAINVGLVCLQSGGGIREETQTRLLFRDDLYVNDAPIPDDLVALRRDLEERRRLAERAALEPRPLATLTDGPLELFGGERENQSEFMRSLEEYKVVLRGMADSGVAAGGYVDKPRSDLLVRLLELTFLQADGKLDQAGHERPLRFVHDLHLLAHRLKPGERSAVFGLRSRSADQFSGALALHFFYLNVGRPGHARLSRVEIPRWVAEQPALLDLLHAALVVQAAQMGAAPYPYLLHRAHETAVVHFEERGQLEAMIVAELHRLNVPVGDKSAKQTGKDLPGRRRTGR